MSFERHVLFGSIAALSIVAGISVGCGDDPPPINNTASCVGDCECTGDTCTCKQGGNCTFGPTGGTGADGGLIDGGAAPPDNVTYHCDAKGTCEAACGTGCTTTCEGQSTCNSTCESNCTATCNGTSECNIDTGTNSTVTCGGGSDCAVELGEGSKLECQGNSTCTIKCPQGGCTAECAGSAGCSIECGAAKACTITCNGQKSEDCAAGTTCAGTCGNSTGGDAGEDPSKKDAGPPSN
jgi:hypothetical protein